MARSIRNFLNFFSHSKLTFTFHYFSFCLIFSRLGEVLNFPYTWSNQGIVMLIFEGENLAPWGLSSFSWGGRRLLPLVRIPIHWPCTIPSHITPFKPYIMLSLTSCPDFHHSSIWFTFLPRFWPLRCVYLSTQWCDCSLIGGFWGAGMILDYKERAKFEEGKELWNP